MGVQCRGGPAPSGVEGRHRAEGSLSSSEDNCSVGSDPSIPLPGEHQGMSERCGTSKDSGNLLDRGDNVGNEGQKGRQLMFCSALVWADHPLPGGNVLVPAGALEVFFWLHFPSGTLLGSWAGGDAWGHRGPGSPW